MTRASWLSLGLACSEPERRLAGDDSTPARSLTTPSVRQGIRFAAERARPGDRVGALEVDQIEAVRAIDSTWVGTARFRGRITLSGRTMAHFEPDAQAVCFEADSASASRLPRWDGDERRSWFCFENTSDAARGLGLPGVLRTATVSIDRFTIHRGLSDQVNSARLVTVLSVDGASSQSNPNERGSP